MKPLTQRVHGKVYVKEGEGALLLDEAMDLVYLRHALIVQGTQQHIFPAVALDDWGHERKTLALYDWIYEEGQRFPRAEVFGFDRTGAETQYFLRDLETYFKWPCYAYPEKGLSLPAGERIHTVLLPDPAHDGPPAQTKRPTHITGPLRRAAVEWQHANPHTLTTYGFIPYHE